MKYQVSVPIAVFVLLLSLLPAGAQDFEKGLAAARVGDFAAALAQWRPLANDGNVEAQFSLGAIYETGLGVPADPTVAAGWYAQAAGRGHAKAQYNLAIMYADGRGVPRDDLRAALWLRKAAEQNHGKAQYNLGIFYEAGRGLTKDETQARFWYGRAAANGIELARAKVRKPGTKAAVVSPLQEPVPKDAGFAELKSSGPTDTATLNTDEKLLDPQIAPAEANTVGLKLNEADQTITAKSETAAQQQKPESEPKLDPASDPKVASLTPALLRIAASFPDGVRYRLEVTETRERKRDGGFVMAQASEMSVDMVVKPGRGGGVLIEWTFGPATVKTAGDPKAGRLASELGKLIEGQRIEYYTNQSGKVTQLNNPSQLLSFYEKSLDRILNGIDAQSADPQLVNDIRANVAPLLSQDYAAERALDLPKLLHFFSGLELAAGKTYSRASVMSLPPSADALASTLDYELKWSDPAAGVAWLSWRQSVDPERAAEAVKAYIETLVAQSGQPAVGEYEIGAIDVSDGADYEIDLATGFPKQVIYTRKVELFGFTQTEKRRIRVLQ